MGDRRGERGGGEDVGVEWEKGRKGEREKGETEEAGEIQLGRGTALETCVTNW